MAPVPELRPLTARSAILSVLLGAHPPRAGSGELVAWGEHVGIGEPAVRVALTRMVSAGDLVREDGVYTLAPRLVERQARQDRSFELPTEPWDGTWHLAVTTAVGSDAAARAALRAAMTTARFGELREGVWMRPANLSWRPDPAHAASLEVLSARPERDPRELASRLFTLDDWAEEGDRLLDHFRAVSSLRDRVTAAAAIVRHLTADPLLPPELLPPDPPAWPGERLRTSYLQFRDELRLLQRDLIAR
jgi:phenylacetic acid degradation operon negative regulatory protein